MRDSLAIHVQPWRNTTWVEYHPCNKRCTPATEGTGRGVHCAPLFLLHSLKELERRRSENEIYRGLERGGERAGQKLVAHTSYKGLPPWILLFSPRSIPLWIRPVVRLLKGPALKDKILPLNFSPIRPLQRKIVLTFERANRFSKSDSRTRLCASR